MQLQTKLAIIGIMAGLMALFCFSAIYFDFSTPESVVRYRNDEASGKGYASVKAWMKSQPELKPFVLDKLKNGKLPGKLTEQDVGKIAGESRRLDRLEEKPVTKEHRANFKKEMGID